MTTAQAPSVLYPTQQRKQTRGILLAAAAVAAAAALLELLYPPSSAKTLTTAADYTFTAMLIPFVLATLAAITRLHQLHNRTDGRLGTAGFWLACAGFTGFLPCAIASLVTGESQALSPLYILSILASLAGLAAFAVAVFRARLLPRWAGPVLPIAWLLGGPVTAGLRGTTFILAITFIAIAITLPAAPGPQEQQSR